MSTIIFRVFRKTKLMFLYTTVLLIQDQPVRYEVSSQGKSDYLIYKPERHFRKTANLPSFWITRKNGKWAPLNIDDKQLNQQLLKDMLLHKVA